VKPGDALVGVGGRQLTSYGQLAAALASAPRPCKLDFLRRRRRVDLARQATASAAASEDSSSPSGSAPSVHQLLARGVAAVPSVHRGGKLVLRSVSGATLASVAAGARAASQRPAGGAPAGGGAADAAALSARLPPMVCGIMGPSGAGKTSLLDCLVRTRARACI
jgi:ABC-type multidrug transport system fused ATPase/permease subunit